MLRHRQTSYKWGKPGSGVGYDQNSNKINIDFMHCLVVGFEHARADVMREIGYAYLSRSYPERMQKVYKELSPLLVKSRKASAKKGPQLSKDEYKQMRVLSAEWQLRHMLFKAAAISYWLSRSIARAAAGSPISLAISCNCNGLSSDLAFRITPIGTYCRNGSE